MRGLRKFCQRVSNFDNALFFSLVNEGRKNSNFTIIGLSLAHRLNDI